MQKFTLLSHNGEDTIQCYLETCTHPKAIVQICHGMCEYYERYEGLRTKLLQNGYAVCGHDHVGHGDSVSDKERYGYFGSKDGHRVLSLDTHAVSAYVRDKLPRLPLFLIGHSMGSFVVRDYISTYGSEVAGAILIGTSGPNGAIGAGKALAKSICAAKGDTHRSIRLFALVFGTYNRRIQNPVTWHDWLCRDPDVVVKFVAQEKCTFIFTARGFYDMFELLDRVSRSAAANAVPKDMPILLLSGAEDPVGNYGKGVTQVYDMLCSAGVKNVDFTLYPEMRHEILNEYGKEQVLSDIVCWLEKCL